MRRELQGGKSILAAAVVATAIGIWLIGAGAALAACDTPGCVGDHDATAAAQLIVLANADRASAGLPPLTPRDDVTVYAVEHSQRMAANGDIEHNDGYFTADVRQRLDAKALGENVAMNRSMDDAHARLMASPGHRANLMDPRFTIVGFAVVRDAAGIGYITQNFVEPRSATPAIPGALSPAPPPSPGPPAAPGRVPVAPAPRARSTGLSGASPTTASGPIKSGGAGTGDIASAAAVEGDQVADGAAGALESEPVELAAGPNSRPRPLSNRSLPVVLVMVALVLVAVNALSITRSGQRRQA